MLGIVGSRQRVVRWQLPPGFVFGDRQPVPKLQMALDHLALIAALDADDVVSMNRMSHRHHRNTSRFFHYLVANTAQCGMDRRDQTADLVSRSWVLSHIRRYDLSPAGVLGFRAPWQTFNF